MIAAQPVSQSVVSLQVAPKPTVPADMLNIKRVPPASSMPLCICLNRGFRPYLKLGIRPTIQGLLLRSKLVSWLEVVMLSGMVPRSLLLPKYKFVRKLVAPIVSASVPVMLHQVEADQPCTCDT